MAYATKRDEIGAWEAEGGKAAPEMKYSEEGCTELPKKLNECLMALSKVAVREIVSNRDYVKKEPTREYIGAELISVWSTDTLHDVIKTLRKHRISSVPVLETGGAGGAQGTFKGFVDMLDIVGYINARAKEPFDNMKIDALRQLGDELLAAPAVSAVDKSSKNPSFPVCEDNAATQALEILAKGVHRIPLFSQDKKLTGLCSQSDLVRFMSDQFKQGVGVGMASKSLRDYGCLEWGPAGELVSILPTMTVQQAIGKMTMAGVQDLAVVSPTDGSLIGQMCAHDVSKAFHEICEPAQLLHRLSMKVGEFVEAYSPEVMKPQFELPSVSLETVCKELADSHAHCIWIVDTLESMRPVAVCTTTDVCRILQTFRWPSWLQQQ